MDNLSVSTSSSDPPNLDNLPDLLYYYVLKNLDLDELWDLRLVSKRLYGIVKSHKIYELSFMDLIYSHDFGNWYSTNKSVKLGNQLDFSEYHLLLNPSNNLLDLKYLRIWNHDPLSIRLDDLNKFTKLQILEIGIIELRSKNLLQLPDLKALRTKFSSEGSKNKNGHSLVIDAPKLHSLSIWVDCAITGFNKLDLLNDVVQFNYPQSVKHLQLKSYDKNAPIFTNLESLDIYTSNMNNLEIDNIMKLKSLKKLVPGWILSNRDGLKYLLRSKKNDFEVILEGVKLKDINKIDEHLRKKSVLEFQLNNYSELDDDLFKSMTYNELVHLSPDTQSIFTKYTNIQCLGINSKIEDTNRLIHFIKKCSNLSFLDISESSLNQQFYDQLPAISSLNDLIIFYEDLNLNFEFMMKMPYLKFFLINQDVLMSKKFNLNYFKSLKLFALEINNQGIEIEKRGKDRYRILKLGQLHLPKLKYIDQIKLNKWCNWLRNKKEKRSNQ